MTKRRLVRRRVVKPAPTPLTRRWTEARRSVRRHVIFGIILVVLLAGGVGGWAATSEIKGAVIAQGSIVAYIGVPSFVVTLSGYLIWQGVILGRLEVPGSIIIQDRWINYTANYYFSPLAGWLIAAVITGLYALSALLPLFNPEGREMAAQRWRGTAAKVALVALASFGTVAICNHAVVASRQLGLPPPPS